MQFAFAALLFAFSTPPSREAWLVRVRLGPPWGLKAQAMPKLPLLLAAIALLASCRTLAATPEIRGTHWDVTRIDASPASGFISFGSDSFDANFGCNRVQGQFRMEGDVLVIGPVNKSQMACVAVGVGADGDLPVSLMQLEDAALLILSGAVRQIWRGENDLVLRGSGGEIALTRRDYPPHSR